MAKNFTDQYKDSRWQKKRLEILERDGWKCHACGKGADDAITLNVHHAFYERGRKVWEYDNGDLMSLCEGCHALMHEVKKEFCGGLMMHEAYHMKWMLNCMRKHYDLFWAFAAWDDTCIPIDVVGAIVEGLMDLPRYGKDITLTEIEDTGGES